MPAKSWVLAGAALLTFAAPASAATFSVTIGSPVGTDNCGFVTTGDSSTPVSKQIACALSPGGLNGLAAASLGQVSAASGAFHNGNFFGSAFGINASSRFTDFVTFTSTDPSVSIVTVGGMNLAFSGVQSATAAANAYVVASLFFGGGFSFEATEDRVVLNTFQTSDGSVTGPASNALLRSAPIQVFVNQPIFLAMSLSAASGVSGNGPPASARSDFSNTFEVPFGMDVFVLPPGVTANAGDWLVNNRRVGGPDPIPEPSAWALLIAGFGLVGAGLRARARQDEEKEFAPCP